MPLHSPGGLATFMSVTSRLHRRTPLAAAVIALGLLATACGADGGSSGGGDSAAVAAPTASQPDSTTSSDSAAASTAAPISPEGDATTATSAPVTAPVPVPEALQFTAPLVGGGEFNGADYAGKPTVFWFWAPT